MRRFVVIACATLAALTVAVAPAWAALRIYGATNVDAVVYAGDSGINTLYLGTDLDGGDAGDTLTFRVKKRSEVVILFNAECAVRGTTGGWINLDILVDGVAVPPSDQDNAFCAGKGTTKLDEWASNVVNAVVKLEAGDHDVQVNVNAYGGVTEYRIDDTSLIVIVPKG